MAPRSVERATRYSRQLADEVRRETQNEMDDYPLTRDEAIALVANRHNLTAESVRFALRVAKQV